MSESPQQTRDSNLPTARFSLAITLAIQLFTSLAATSTAVLAPEIGRDLSVAPKLVGVFVGLVYIGSMSASLVCGGFIERYGPIRVSQVCVMLCAAGLLMVAGGTQLSGALLLALLFIPIVIGLGYGPITAASSQILVRTTPPSRMALTFSIKQTGVPGGAALAGALLPIVALRIGWHAAFGLVAALGVVITLIAQSARASLDYERMPDRTLSPKGIFAPLGHVMRTPVLRELAMLGFVYAALQVCLMSFLVVYLTETLHFSLVAAGFALTAANLGGIAGRIIWGLIADMYIAPRTMLGIVGIVAGACAWLAATFASEWPTVLIVAVCTLFGATAVGWNGVQLAHIARNAPAGQVGAITGAAGFVTFGGVVVGPPTFALISAVTSSYRIGFATFGSLTLGCGLWLLVKGKS